MQHSAARIRFLGLLHAAITDGSLVKLTLGKYRGTDASLKNIHIRPVSLKAGPRLSFVHRHATHDITKNHAPQTALALLEKLIGADFLDAHLFTMTQTVRLECAPGGPARIHLEPTGEKAAAAAATTATPLAHDRQRNHPIPAGAPWLRALGVTNDRAHPRAGMAAKFNQINKFAELLPRLAREAGLGDAQSKIHITDMGCGKGYLTFAAASLFGARASVQGIEARPGLVDLCNRVAREHHFDNLRFIQGSIAGAPLRENTPEILVALHACDTATDDAIAWGVRAGARLILVSPCCQKELRPQLTAPPILAPALRHGIFLERHAEFATDALRAQLLEYAGYRANVFEFVSAGHTAKNLMIAAIKTRPPGDAPALEKLRAFARFYGIRRQALAAHLGVPLS